MRSLVADRHALAQDARLAFRTVVRQARRSFAALLSVAAGVVALILAGGFIDWIYWSMRETTIGSRLGHIQVVISGYFKHGTANPFDYLLPAQSADSDTISRLPDVVAVAPRLVVSGLVSHGDETASFLGEGIDPALEAHFDRYVTITAGRGLSADDPEAIIVGEGLASNLGVNIGDTVVLIANRRSGGINAIEVRVRGTFATATKAYDDTALRMPLSAARRLLDASGAHAWVVILDDTGRTDAVAAQVASAVADRRLEVVPWHRLADFYNKTVELFSKQVGVMKVIILVIVVLSISNTFMRNIMERTSEIGTMMALGASRTTILRRFLLEGAVLGVLGGAVGAVVAILFARVISVIGIPMPPPPGMSHGFVGAIRVEPALVAEAFALAVLTTLAACVYPSWKASRMSIVDALRHNR